MNTMRWGRSALASFVALSLGLALPLVSTDAFAQGKGKPKEKDKKEAPAAEAPSTAKPVSLKPAELAWGIGWKKLAEIYDKVIDEDYKAKYKKVQPGPEMDRLDAEVAEKKAEFRRTRTEFNQTTTGYDSTPLLTEYSYGNKEALMVFSRGGKTRYFFFIGDKLWKIIDVEKLGEKSRWGKTFDEAVAKVNKAYGVDGRVRDADAANGRPFKEVDWKDAVVQVRAVDWADDQFVIAFQESATVANLPNLRKNKKQDATRVDDKVKDAGRKEPEAPPPPKDPKKNPKK
ncbi:MAG: hypothetical protein JNL21_02055 [Myxococcales bacterium]|nr:hypothetical protein [Myxococcales bacterium]